MQKYIVHKGQEQRPYLIMLCFYQFIKNRNFWVRNFIFGQKILSNALDGFAELGVFWILILKSGEKIYKSLKITHTDQLNVTTWDSNPSIYKPFLQRLEFPIWKLHTLSQQDIISPKIPENLLKSRHYPFINKTTWKTALFDIPKKC